MENDKGVTADYSSFPIVIEGGCGYRLNNPMTRISECARCTGLVYDHLI